MAIETLEQDSAQEDISTELKIEGMSEADIISQIQVEYKHSFDFIRPKLNEWLVRLQVYNNQKRDVDKVGDPLLFTVFQTVLASLYDDDLSVEFLPREEGDIERAEALNNLAEFDQEQMQKAKIDFEWIWDTLFFGRGLLLFQEFDRKCMNPVPQVIDPATFLRDPRATSINGDLKGNNSARFFGREISLTKWELAKSPVYFDIDQLRQGRELQSLLEKMTMLRRDAQGLGQIPINRGEDSLKGNKQFDLLEWWTHIEGKKYLITLGNSRTKIIRYTKMQDQKDWAVIDRPLFPIAHDWDGVSIPDIVEDKQRARAILTNLGLASAKADLYPMYLFDTNKISNRNHLNFGFNKFIPINGATTGAIDVVNKPVVHQQVNWIMDILDQSAQRALATPEIQQGQISKQKRTLGELELVSAKVDTRFSLAAKIFGWSEKIFWRQWYNLYKNNFKAGIDKKVIRLTGVYGAEFRPLKQNDIITKVDPDIKIESKVLSEAKRMRERADFSSFATFVINDPNTNRKAVQKKLAQLNGLSKQEITFILPPTLDELEAEEENELIEKKQTPRVDIREDHMTHVQTHNKLSESTARDNHLELHKKAMILKRKNIEVFRERDALLRPDITPQMPTKQKEKPAQGRSASRVPETFQTQV